MATAAPRWVKRLEACRYASVGRTKLDGWIAQGRVRAKKDEGGGSAPVFVDLNSIDELFERMRDAPGQPRQRTTTKRKRASSNKRK
jgi:hypothetical protein